MKHVLRTIFFSIFLSVATKATSSEVDELSQPLTGPITSLKAHDEKVRNLLKDQGDTLNTVIRDTLKLRINSIFDFKELSKLALGTHWEQITEQEKKQFVNTFSAIIREQNFDTFLTYYRDGKLNYDEEYVDGETATVNASVPLKRGSVSIAYSMHVVDKTWQIYDVAIDSASTAEGNRKRYDRYIRKHSYEKLILQLEKQLDRLKHTGK
ncbi:MAG: ABC transporter substrate-binding protein [Candidatus Latescibacterota bacterium]|nr:ABC transporter substrate-binding protein [Candidatus Latescibacterota bacterium]